MTSVIVRLRSVWSNRRSRIVISALVLGAIFGAFDVTLPLDDLFISARAKLRDEPADGSIVVVKLDDKTLEAIHDTDVNPARDAQLIARLMEAGANEVYFDRTYPFSEKSMGADNLIGVLAKYPGRVHFGATGRPGARSRILDVMPAPEFRKNTRLVALMVAHHPLNLSFSFPMATPTVVGSVPSLAASLADVEGSEDAMFRADFGINPATIPAVSYVDVLEGRVGRSQIVGRKFVVGWTSSTNEVKPLPLGEFLPAVYFHVIAAQTLKNGPPVDLGWVPAFLVVAAMICTGVGRGRSFKPMRLVGHGVVLIGLPFLLDRFHVEYAVMPSAVMAIYATFRARTLDKMKDVSETNASSGLPSLQALRSRDEPSQGLLIALKIRNYAGIIRSFPRPIEAELANEIQRRIRLSEPDVTVYHEGDMFVWVSNLGDMVELFENLEGLHRIVQNGIVLEGTEVDVGFNCGIDSDRVQALPQRLANAMQSAEEAVRSDELACHHDAEKGEEQWEISLLASLDRAIDNGEVWVAFQPKLDLATNTIVGAEALARWTHPERGPISPEKFIGIAEEYHRIERITRFVLDKAIRAAKSIVREGREFTVAVNISAQLLRNPRLPRMISDALAAHDLAPAHLVLEITETDRLDRSAKTVEMMKELVAAGLTISIDDFGTGNATIDYLRYLPASEVKIDKVFIRDIESNPNDQLLVQSIIEMAHSLGRRVVAEGVETAESLSLLGQLKCDQIQGYYVGRPVPIRDFYEHLAQSQVRATG
jgi:EAL domain-containing protein (putative c-di-GMP-specific phosphodiesterase class I)